MAGFVGWHRLRVNPYMIRRIPDPERRSTDPDELKRQATDLDELIEEARRVEEQVSAQLREIHQQRAARQQRYTGEERRRAPRGRQDTNSSNIE